jgi:hypothetical protein
MEESVKGATVSHMVIFRSADGRPGYHQSDELADAAAFVERLRNDDGVEHARIFRMEEVTFEFRPYYRVTLGHEPPMPAVEPEPAMLPEPHAHEAMAPEGMPAEPVPMAEAPPMPMPMPPMVEPDHVPVVPLGANGSVAGRRGLFGR